MKSQDNLVVPLMEEEYHFNRASKKSAWIRRRFTFGIFAVIFIMVMVAYTLKVSLTYEKVLTPPAFNVIANISVTALSNWEVISKNGFQLNVIIFQLSFLNSFVYDTDCPDPFEYPINQYRVIAFNNLTAGCYLNLTFNYTLPQGAVSNYELMTMTGFSYPGDGDYAYISSGVISNGEIASLETVTTIASISGNRNSVVYVAAGLNNFIALNFNYVQIFNFATAVVGISFTVASFIYSVYRWWKGDRVVSSLLLDNKNVTLEV